MIILEKKTETGDVRYIIDKQTIVRDFRGTKEEIPNLYKLFLYTNFHNAYPLNPDYTVAQGLQELGWGNIVFHDTPIRDSDVIDVKKSKKK